VELDANGVPTAVNASDALGRTIRTTYDAQGNQLSRTVGLGTADAVTTSYAYDDAGSLTQLTDPLDNVTTFSYATNGQLIGSTDPLGHTTAATYNDDGLPLTQTDAEGRTISDVYDDQGRKT